MQKLFSLVLATLALSHATSAQCEHLKLVDESSPPLGTAETFGKSLAMDGDLLAIGTPGVSTTGKVDLYELTGIQWRHLQTIPAPTGVFSSFGETVALSGGTLVVGYDSARSVFVFERRNGSWPRVPQVITPALIRPPTQFGSALAVSGDTALVGDWTHAVVQVFQRQPSSGLWIYQGDILDPEGPIPPGSLGSGFGSSVAFDGDLAVIGAPFSTAVPGLTGVAWATRRTPSGWEAPTRLDPVSVSTYGRLGDSVAVSGNRIVVGAWSTQTGYAFVFEDTGSSFVEVARLEAPDPAGAPGFASDVAISGNRVVVGNASRPSGPQTLGTGAAYFYEDDGAGWRSRGILLPQDRGPDDRIGAVVATSGELAALGAPGDDDEGPDFGAVFTFSLAGTICPTLQSFPKAISLVSGGTFTLLLRPGAAFANQSYGVVSTISGMSPGFFASGFFVPLNPDAWFRTLVRNPGAPLFRDMVGTLDSAGRGTATFQVPPGLPLSLAGTKMSWAFGVFDAAGSLTHVSTPVLLRFKP